MRLCVRLCGILGQINQRYLRLLGFRLRGTSGIRRSVRSPQCRERIPERSEQCAKPFKRSVASTKREKVIRSQRRRLRLPHQSSAMHQHRKKKGVKRKGGKRTNSRLSGSELTALCKILRTAWQHQQQDPSTPNSPL